MIFSWNFNFLWSIRVKRTGNRENATVTFMDHVLLSFFTSYQFFPIEVDNILTAQIGRKVSCYNVKKRFSVGGGPHMLGSCKLPKIRKFFMKAITITHITCIISWYFLEYSSFIVCVILERRFPSFDIWKYYLHLFGMYWLFLGSWIKFNLICIFWKDLLF